METCNIPATLVWTILNLAAFVGVMQLHADTTNIPPTVSIERPPPPDRTVSSGMLMKVKAEASDPDGSIARVEFFEATTRGTNMLGVVTNLPYNVLWPFGFEPPYGGPWTL